MPPLSHPSQVPAHQVLPQPFSPLSESVVYNQSTKEKRLLSPLPLAQASMLPDQVAPKLDPILAGQPIICHCHCHCPPQAVWLILLLPWPLAAAQGGYGMQHCAIGKLIIRL